MLIKEKVQGKKLKMTFEKFLLIIFLIGIYFSEIQGRGIMLDPISRSSAWRKGFPVEPNYNDHELFCGGIDVRINNIFNREENLGKSNL